MTRSLPTVLLVLLSVLPARAQLIDVPAFPVGPPVETGWFVVSQDFDVAAADDGGFAVAWLESHATQRGGKVDRWAVVSAAFTSDGTPRAAATRVTGNDDVVSAVAVAGSSAGYAVGFGHGEFPLDAHVYGEFLGLDGAPSSTVDVSERGVQAPTPIAGAGTAVGPVFAWISQFDNDLTVSLWNASGQPRTGPITVVGEAALRFGVAGTADGGFVVAFENDALTRLRFFAADGTGGPIRAPGVSGLLSSVAASPAGDVVAYALRRRAGMNMSDLLVQRVDSTGALVGSEISVRSGQPVGLSDLAFDRNGNLYVVWIEGFATAWARAFDRDGVALGPPLMIADDVVGTIRTARLADRNAFVNVWQTIDRNYANVVTLCAPGSSTCGDGVFDALCERCDDGAGNSDTTPNACRTGCDLPRCGDGVTDAGEECDDGNATACDGCTGCRVDVGLGCGDGIAIPACGETCDDGNTVVGDGCGADCRLERAPGGGAASTDCVTAWSVDNPANQPLRDKHGDFSRQQSCVDDDPRCDFDGGTPGGCTFHVRVCVNNTDQAACTPGTRLSAWTLRAPSASRATKDPVAAAQRNALQSAVLPNVVGPSERDLCSPVAAVVVPLRHGTSAGKVVLKSDALLYSGVRDVDKLRLTCLAHSP